MKIRTLRPSEIECRVQQVKNNGCVLLLYKDARCDMRILDEVFGIDGWEREHQVVNGNLYCTVRIWSEKRQQWISKQDVGTESNTEKQKGEASDSFKRACFNIGIGRELYSAPFVWINLDKSEVQEENRRYKLDYKVKFEIKEIEYNEDREISKLVIIDQNGKERFRLNPSNTKNKMDDYIALKDNAKSLSEAQLKRMYVIGKNAGYENSKIDSMINQKYNKKACDMTKEEYDNVVEGLQKIADAKAKEKFIASEKKFIKSLAED